MPEAYTHIRIARAALAQSGQTAASAAAFEMGANGPDPLFAYKVLARRRPYDLAALGNRLHEEQCGAFLRALVFRAWSPAQRSYVLGFLTHYAADATLHPYVEAACREGGQFCMRHGHGFCEVALDSFFHAKYAGGAAVPVGDAAPALYTVELAEVAELLPSNPVESALDFLWNMPEVNVVLSGMSTTEQVEQNMAYAAKAHAGMLTDEQVEKMILAGDRMRAKFGVPCTACGYCNVCPQEIAIPKIFSIVNQMQLDGDGVKARNAYKALGGHDASHCVQCGLCVEQCPQHIEIFEELAKIAKRFG